MPKAKKPAYVGFKGKLPGCFHSGDLTIKQTKKEIFVTTENELKSTSWYNFRSYEVLVQPDPAKPLEWVAKNDDKGQRAVYLVIKGDEARAKFEPFVRIKAEQSAINALLIDEGFAEELKAIRQERVLYNAIDLDVAGMIEERHGAVPEEVFHNWYEARQEARAARYEEYAANADKRSDQAYKASHDQTKHIPFGQPILLGHHSERKHRNALSKSWAAMGRSVAEQRKAEYWRERSAGIDYAGISSDDPDAIRKLQLQLFPLITSQLLMKEANKVGRSKTLSPREKIIELSKLGLIRAEIQEMFNPKWGRQIGFAGFQLSNNNAKIKRIHGRIDQLKKLCECVDKDYYLIGSEEEDEWMKVEERPGENRVFVRFPGKPPEVERKVMSRSCGFNWSKTEVAWSRKYNQSAIWNATRAGDMIRELRGMPTLAEDKVLENV